MKTTGDDSDPDWLMKNLRRVQNKSALSLGNVTLEILLLGKFNSETYRLFETFNRENGLLDRKAYRSCFERLRISRCLGNVDKRKCLKA